MGTNPARSLSFGTENFDRVVQNIRDCVTMRRDCEEPTIGAGYLVDTSTLYGMVKAAELCKMLGVDYLQFRPYHHAASEPNLYEHVMREYGNARLHETTSYAVVLSEHKFKRLGRKNPARRYGACYGHAFATTICANGDVTLCCHMRGKPKYTLGNIYQESWEDIWAGTRRKYVADHIDFKDCVDLCRCDPFNEILWDLRDEPTHVNFL